MADFTSPWLDFSPETARYSGIKSIKSPSETFDTPISKQIPATAATLPAPATVFARLDITRPWDENEAYRIAGGRFCTIGDFWPAGISMTEGEGAAVAHRYGAAVCAALDAASWEMLDAAFATFRREFAPRYRQWQATNACWVEGCTTPPLTTNQTTGQPVCIAHQ